MGRVGHAGHGFVPIGSGAPAARATSLVMRSSLLCLAILATPALAQPPAPQPRDVVGAADDAFGLRIGIEEVGLYSESEVRGFSLQSAGNFRIGDHYFVRAASPIQPIIQGTRIRVGVNGLRTDFATPSGTLQYDLATAAPGFGGSVEAGWWGGSGPVLLVRAAAASADGRLSAAGGIQLNPRQSYVDGSRGGYQAAGIVSRWSPAPGVALTAIASGSRHHAGTDTYFASAGAPPPRVRRGLYRGQDWMIGKTEGTLAGLIAEVDAAPGWRFGASAFLSQAVNPQSSFNLLTLPAGGGPAGYLVVITPRQIFRSLSGELVAARSFTTGSVTHRLVAAVRRRDSIARTSPGVSATLGTVEDLDSPPDIAEPSFAFDPRRVHDDVGQWSAGLGYRVTLGGRAELRADVQKARYARRVTDLEGNVARRVTSPWLYSAAAAAGLTRRLTAFASYARGLEESGVAPGNAVNRGALLPATPARQAELGLRYAVDRGPSLIAGLFEIAKPLPGLRADGVYDFVGQVRHRGVELSLAGPLTGRLTAVLGATFFRARLTGELVARRLIGPEPVGRPERAMLASLTWRVPGVEGLALDGGVSLRGGREGDSANSFRLPAYGIVNAGLRQRIEIGRMPFTLRARVANLFNAFAWNAGDSGLYYYNGPRTWTLTVTADL